MNGAVSNESRAVHSSGSIGNGDPGMVGGGTYTMPAGDNRRDPTIQDYENIFGPAARDIRTDLQRNKRHSRWHLPDALKGSNPYLTDRVDGLITDTTASPFTTILLPYKYIENVDAKIKWNVWSFDEGMASRVPYESAARTLTQTKRSYAGYTIRHGLAITMEHNFMMSDKGRENFKNQLQQARNSGHTMHRHLVVVADVCRLIADGGLYPVHQRPRRAHCAHHGPVVREGEGREVLHVGQDQPSDHQRVHRPLRLHEQEHQRHGNDNDACFVSRACT